MRDGSSSIIPLRTASSSDGEQLGLAQAGRPSDDVEPELRAGGGRELEHVGGPGREAREPLADDLAHALGRTELRERPGEPDRSVDDLDELRLDQRAPELADQERVPAGELADRPRELRRAGAELALRGAPDELAHLLAREPGQPQPHDVVGAAQVGERLRERLRDVGLGVAEGGEQQHARVARGPREVTQEQQGRRVGPVPVLEHEQHRPAADAGEQVGHRRVQAVALRVRIGLDRRRQLAHAERQVGQQPRQLAARGAERRAQLDRIDDARQVVERLDERPVGRPHDRVAGAVEDERAAAGRLARELAHQAALARAGLAAQQDDPPALALRHGHERPERLQLGRAADEWKRRRETERAGKIVHAAADRRP